MEMSNSIGKLSQALTAVQAALEPAKYNAANPFFKSKYADLGSVFDACRHLLAENGLSVSQIPGMPPVEYGPSVALTTVLMHESGEWLRDTMILPLAKAEPQAAGSALTYARRYALSAIIGIVADEDDDGNQAGQRSKTKVQKPAGKVTTPDKPQNGFTPGAEVMVRGKNDEKLGTVESINGDTVAVKVDGKTLNVKPDRLTLAGNQEPLFPEDAPPDTTYQE